MPIRLWLSIASTKGNEAISLPCAAARSLLTAGKSPFDDRASSGPSSTDLPLHIRPVWQEIPGLKDRANGTSACWLPRLRFAPRSVAAFQPVSLNVEPFSGIPKRKLENGEQRLAPPKPPVQSRKSGICHQRLVHTSITRGNVGSWRTAGNRIGETALAGRGGRIRTLGSREAASRV
jgi:hypothetical protein